MLRDWFDRSQARLSAQLDAHGLPRNEEADSYAEHLVEQAAHLLRTQDIGILTTTPPVLERLARHDDLVELINQKVKA
jgi:capsular polysaccharide biosynthesis protein